MISLNKNDIVKVDKGLNSFYINIKSNSPLTLYPFGLIFDDKNIVIDNFSDIKSSIKGINLINREKNSSSILIDLEDISSDVSKISLYIGIYEFDDVFSKKHFSKVDRTKVKISLCNNAEIVSDYKYSIKEYGEEFNSYELIELIKDNTGWCFKVKSTGLNTYHLELLNKILN